jgi:formamidopyrimidine-DNA glycosylase
MPELPDVENYRRYLARHALKQRIADVHVGDKRALRVPAAELRRNLKGHTLKRTRRHGKHLLVAVDGGWLTMHFGMTGHLDYFEDAEAEPASDRVRFDFANGKHLGFVDARLLGRVGFADDADAFIAERKLGPDALSRELDAKTFAARLKDRRGGLKAALMDQSVVAGIGNLYADEILFQAKLHPLTPVQKLSAADLKRIHRIMRNVLQTGIKSGAGTEGLYKRLPKSYLIPLRKVGGDCPRCGGKVKMITAAGRSTYFCPACQRRAA